MTRQSNNLNQPSIFQRNNELSSKSTIRNYRVMKLDGISRIIRTKPKVAKAKKGQETIIQPEDRPRVNVYIEELYDLILKEHVAVGQGVRDKTQAACAIWYENISYELISAFVSCCLECKKKSRVNTVSNMVLNPLKSTEYLARVQINLIDLQSFPDGRFKWILTVQDHFTKFLHLRSLENKKAVEVAMHLLEILVFCCPQILQSDNGREFRAQVVEELKVLWPDLKIIHGRPRHPQSQGSVERALRLRIRVQI